MAGTGKIGIKDVAREAGVAISTVSHALNGTAQISNEVRLRVLAVAQRLGYLAERKAKATIATLGTVLLAVHKDQLPHNDINLFSWTMLSGLARECERLGVKLVPYSPEDRLEVSGVVSAARDANADGIIVIAEDGREFLSGIRMSGIPAVLMNGEDQDMCIDSVVPSNRFAARHATNHLISKGHRRILHVTWGNRATVLRRHEGFIDAFRSNGLPMDDACILRASGYEPQCAEEAITRWIADHGGMNGVTAIFCAADNLAIGALRGLSAAGLSVPGDVSVMGFDGVTLGELLDPPLTTIRVPIHQMGPSALALLEQNIVASDPDRATQRLELGCSLVVRASVAQAPEKRT
ncbi:LacI family DNA-binding transcriptional regulator [Rhizobium sp. C4]|uniref:LacI family DNA-binding transcriptional regulator n=1 Tax=Rhizobium sp. C4 TaxID=1349800 RepID=UPI001E42EE7E|nr:LacI family DNA-binding transcriptional regulator [Rhizobium sp. C4]MCD2172472.1 LacI family transcriptional regulator [Rhizobium sp. C4]